LATYENFYPPVVLVSVAYGNGTFIVIGDNSFFDPVTLSATGNITTDHDRFVANLVSVPLCNGLTSCGIGMMCDWRGEVCVPNGFIDPPLPAPEQGPTLLNNSLRDIFASYSGNVILNTVTLQNSSVYVQGNLLIQGNVLLNTSQLIVQGNIEINSQVNIDLTQSTQNGPIITSGCYSGNGSLYITLPFSPKEKSYFVLNYTCPSGASNITTFVNFQGTNTCQRDVAVVNYTLTYLEIKVSVVDSCDITLVIILGVVGSLLVVGVVVSLFVILAIQHRKQNSLISLLRKTF